MTWFLRSRQALHLGAVTVAVVLATCALTRVLAPVPSLVPVSARGIAAALALPVVAALPLIGMVAGGYPERELTSVRRIFRTERGMVLVGVGAAATILAIAALLLDAPLLLAAARNVAGTAGLGLLLRRWLPPMATALIPIAVAAATFSLANRVEPPLWAWLLAPVQSLPAALIATVLFTMGLFLGIGGSATRRQASASEF